MGPYPRRAEILEVFGLSGVYRLYREVFCGGRQTELVGVCGSE